MKTALDALHKYIQTGETDKTIQDIDLPDIPLWAVWCIQQYYKFFGASETIEKYGDILEKIINFILDE